MIDPKIFYDVEGVNIDREKPKVDHAAATEQPLKAIPLAINNIQGENIMAVEDMLSDIRREAAEHTNEIVKEGIKGDYNTQGDIKDARYDINSGVVAASRSSDDRFFVVGRDLADVRAQIIESLGQIKAQGEITALKTQIAVKEDGDVTRALINDLKYNDLNRALVERNAELVEERHYGRHWRHFADQGQWQSLNSQLQAFQSQLQETRQGMVNFGTMAGVGQTSTSNNVR
jgi:hypothetical protein